MTQNAEHPDQELVNQIDWSQVRTEPAPDIVNELDQELPPEWLQFLEEPELETVIDQDITELINATDEELAARVQEATKDLALDVEAIMGELPSAPARPIDLDIDLGR